MLFCVQWMASLLQGWRVVPRGAFGLVVLVLKFIGFSYRSAMDENAGFMQSLLGFTFGVGFCEELCKAIPVVVLLRNARSVGWRAAALVGMASGVGFGTAEGVIYSADFYNGIAGGWTYLVRFASCVSLHAIWAGAVALLMYGNQDYLGDDEFDWLTACNFVLHYLAIAMVLHGLYDTLLKMEQDWWALAAAAGSFAWLMWLVWRYRGAE
jgi:RsiW-degrading membrane proteinase PrsW (M82 family)